IGPSSGLRRLTFYCTGGRCRAQQRVDARPPLPLRSVRPVEVPARMRRPLIVLSLAALLVGSSAPAFAQSTSGGARPVFRIEADAEPRRGVVSGWLYNDGGAVVGLVRLRLETLDTSGQVLGEYFGWAYGNVPPGGRAYFRISTSPTQAASRRISVESFV